MVTIRMPACRHIIAGILSACVAAPSGAFAKTAAYVGTWAAQSDQCKVGQEMENAPLIVTTRGYDRHETHCVFGFVSRKASTWRTRAKCDVGGDKQTLGLTLTVTGEQLTIKYSSGGAESYQRCP